ncbi:PA2169 family four-helix-bundle protein [Arenibacter sp. F26102]|uniref:PA2169 family four-helix-bundle protein n=1 Tax=Arenibacter sp. F26102 TaxID=2926416 RepID=UPI001FF37751|nr:PA2169 family four-helix-bundle protein [Arenibacter sp. F26102]MCK0147268.1 PA2169 family four-helix-bundle protein [Arenibacter sp. F26102]
MDTISIGTLVKLKEIMRRNKEVEKAYHNAANNSDNKKLIHYFRRKSKEWKNFGESLKIKVRAALPASGEQKVEMDVMEMPSLDNGDTTLKRFSQRERAEVDEYRKILEGQKLPFDIYHLIRIHKMWIEVDLSKSML